MIIKKYDGDKVELRHVNPGEVFVYEDEFYILTDETDDDDFLTATNLRTGYLGSFSLYDSVCVIENACLTY